MIVQKDRNYLLRVGTPGKGYLEISGLNIQFKVQKSTNNKYKGNHASISIYNLSAEHRHALEESGLVVALDVGYGDTGLHELFSGQITDVKSETARQSEDLVTSLTLDALYSGLNHKMVSKLVAPNSTIEELIRQLAKEMPDIVQTKFSGDTLKTKIPDGYPINGTPRQTLSEICDAYGLEWQVDGSVLYVTDVTASFMKSEQAFILNEASGLIERPEQEEVDKKRAKGDKKKKGRKGLKITCLLNPLIKAGGLIRLEFGDLSGDYKVIDINHQGEVYGNAWTTTLSVASN
jgi:hypothetical protein